jgi:hypothetical protein
MKVYSGTTWLEAYASLAGALLAVNNLNDVSNVVSARANLGLGTAATTNSTAYATAAQGTLADNAVSAITSNDGSVVITTTGTSRDLSVGIAGSTATLISQVRNQTGATLTKGTLVYITGANGSKALVSKALATGDATSAQTYGMVQADISNNQNGYVVVIGVVSGLDTSTFAEGAQLYLSGATAGAYTSTKPYAPLHLVYVGVVTRSHANQGTIEVKIQNGYEMDELHDVSAQSPTNGDTLVYVSSTGLWTKTPQSTLSVASAASVPFSGVTGKPTTLSGYGITDGYNTSNPAGYISGITSGMVTTALGYTPYNATNPSNYITTAGARSAISVTGAGSYDSATGVINIVGGVTSFNTRTGAITLNSSDVTTALGFTPYNATNPNGYITGITSSNVTTALGFTPYNATNPSGYISGITSGMVTTALGYTPYNSSNPSGYITSAALSPYLLLAGGTLTGRLVTTASAEADSYAGAIRVSPNNTQQWGGISFPDTNAGTSNANNYWFYGRGAAIADRILTVHIPSYEDYGSTGTIPSWGVYRTGAVSLLRVWADGSVTASGNQVLTAGNYNSYAPTLTGGGASGTWGINITGNAATATLAATATSAPNYLPLAGGTMSGGINFLGTVYNTVSGAKLFAGNSGYTYMYTNTNGFLWRNQADSTTVAILTDAGAFNAISAITQNGNQVLHAGNYTSYSPSLTGSGASGTWGINISGSAVLLTSTQGNWNSTGVINNVVGMLGWKNYSNSHVIFDASASTTPSGGACSNTNPQNNWTGTYPTLMGWNGANTYGVRVDSARVADSAGSAGSVDFANLTNKGSGTGTYTTSGDYRAPIFYDSNNTGFYTDPAGISNMDTVTAVNFRMGNALYLGSNNNYINNNSTWFGTNSSFRSDTDIRATIFYDSTDTSFYVDPHNISRFSKLAIGNVDYSSGMQVGSLALGNVGTNYHYTSGWSTSMNGGILANCADNWEFVIHDSANRLASPFVFWGGGSNYIEMGRDLGWGTTPIFATASFRAPIFYDSNDTAFYVDPNSNSYINTLNVAFTNFRSHIDIYGPIYSYKNDSGYILQSFNQSAGNPAQFNIRHSLGDTIIENARGIIYENSTFSQANNSYRAPIFYDSNNTAFYVDPNGATNIGAWTSNASVNLQRGSGGAVYQTIENTDSGGTYAYLHLNQSGGGNGYLIKNRTTGNSVSNQSLYLWNDPGPIEFVPAGTASLRTTISTGGNMTVATDVRTPIFYDSGNTAGYADLGNGTVRVYAASGGQGGFTVADTGGFLTYRITTNNSGNGWSWRFTTNEAVATSFDTFFSVAYDTGIAQVSGTNPSFRAPIFYDSNDTTYYLDPSSSGVSLRIGGAIQGNHTTWTGEMNKIQWHSGNLYFQNTSDGVFTFRNSNGAEPYTLNANGNGTASGSWRAPIFYDSNNTNFYVDPEGISSLYGVAIRGDQSPTDTSNQIFFWSAGNTTTSAIGFKNNGGNFPNPTGQGDGYNTYLTMDSVGRGWVFRRGVGGSDFSSAYTSGWILNNGIWQSNGDMRAPIFYDANDTAFYADPSSGSSYRYQILRGTWNNNPFGVSEQFTIRGNYPSYCLRNTDVGSYWLVHHAMDQTINWYGGNSGGVDGSAWNRNLFLDMAGNLTARNNITAYSDVRLKTNIKLIDNPLEKVKRLRGVYFNWKETGTLSVGMIAQEVELVFPELVLTSSTCEPGKEDSKETKSLDYSKIVSVLVEAIKEQDQEVLSLKAKVDKLELLITKLIKE